MLLKVAAFIAVCAVLTVTADEQPKFGGSFEPTNRDYLAMYDGDQQQQQQQQADAAAYNATTSVDAVIDMILATGRQGRNLDSFADVYADPTVQDALAKADDRQARNIIKDKLCSLGLMDCDNNIQIDGKRPFLPPGELIYSQPPPGYHQSGALLSQRPPPPQMYQQRPPPPGAYGPARPMPPPPQQQQSGNNKYNGPPRKVGYAGSPYPNGGNNNNGNYLSRPPGSSLYVESKPPGPFYEGPSPPGPIYQSQQSAQRPFDGQIFEGPKPPGPIYDESSNNAPPPYKFDSSSSSSLLTEKYETVADYPTQKIVATGNGANSQAAVNIHHHYHHLDGATDGAGTKTVIVNPVSATQGAASYVAGAQQVSSLNSLSASAEFSSLGGFSPMSFGGQQQQQLGYGNGQSASAYKPIVEPSNSLTGISGPGGVYDGAVNSYGGIINTAGSAYAQQQLLQQQQGLYSVNPQQSFHSQNPEFYKKALNTNSGGGASGNSLSSLSQYSKYNTQFNTGENQYQQQQQGFETARQETFDCVCVPFEQCPTQDVIGRKDDLILPLDPRHLKTDIEAAGDEMVLELIKQGNNATTTAANATAKVDVAKKDEKMAAATETEERSANKKVKRETAAEAEQKSDDEPLDQADGQAVRQCDSNDEFSVAVFDVVHNH